MNVTVTLGTVACGTEVSILQEGIPDVIRTESCYLGWQESLLQLARRVEPEIQRRHNIVDRQTFATRTDAKFAESSATRATPK